MRSIHPKGYGLSTSYVAGTATIAIAGCHDSRAFLFGVFHEGNIPNFLFLALIFHRIPPLFILFNGHPDTNNIAENTVLSITFFLGF
jgi:hypothetical protein